ncbi:MAG: hypothetical protein LBU85_11970 [Treponema sp.]|jgi:hypothetical protein|nr:hypothetical protein [Treponema sp.]
MKKVFILLVFASLCNLYSQEHIENYLLCLRNILNYDTPGYQEITLGNALTYRVPLSIDPFPRSGDSIRPYDVFIKCYNKNTKEEYYTRSSFIYINDGYLYFNQDFILVNTAFPEANNYLLTTMNDTSNVSFYVYLMKILFLKEQGYEETIGQYKEEIIGELKLSFYRPKGKITANVNNVFFQFEAVEETEGCFLHGRFDLSNIDLRAEIMKLYSYINTIELESVRNKYTKKLDSLINILDDDLDNDLDVIIDMPHIIRMTITQFYSMEVINNLR